MFDWKRALTLALLGSAFTAANAQYTQVNLISDGFVTAAHTDPNFLNAWGVAFSPTGPFWINENGSGISSVFDGAGAPFPAAHPIVVTVPPLTGSAPTGIVFNGGNGFQVSNGTTSAPSVFIFVTEDGVISGWNPTIDPVNGIPVVDNVVPGSVYKGAALDTFNGHTMLYAANFNEGKVDVFDSNWNMVNSFTDPNLPSNYSPFNVVNINGVLVVTFAQTDADRHDDVRGAGHGFVDLFSPTGHMIHRFISRGPLNSPWGVALAPHSFGHFHDHLLVGNFGDGTINAFDFRGRFDGSLRSSGSHHPPLVIDGLWSLVVGNGHLGGDANKVYFTAGPNGEADGLFGYIRRVED